MKRLPPVRKPGGKTTKDGGVKKSSPSQNPKSSKVQKRLSENKKFGWTRTKKK